MNMIMPPGKHRLSLKLLASRKARMRMLDVIEAMPPEQYREKLWGLERVERINKREQPLIIHSLILGIPLTFFCLLFLGLPVIIQILLSIPTLLLMSYWVNTDPLDQIEARIKNIRRSLRL